MDALQLKVDSIRGEVGEISSALRAYLDHGIASGRKVQPPKTKAGRDLLQHLLGRLDQASTGLADVHNRVSHTSQSPPAIYGPGTPPSIHPVAGAQQIAAPATEPAGRPNAQTDSASREDPPSSVPAAADAEPEPEPPTHGPEAPSAAIASRVLAPQDAREIRLSNGSVYQAPLLSEHAAPLFDCTYQDIRVLNEELFELYSSHPVVRDRGYFKLQVRDLPPLNVQKVARPTKDHATSFTYKADHLGLVKVDTGKRFKFAPPNLPLPVSAKTDWSLQEQQYLWNSSAADPPKGTWPYIIGNPLFDDVELSPGEKLRRRGRTILEGINTQYVYFNLTGKTLTTMHREDAHVRSENLLRSGQHKFWCFVKPVHSRKLEERLAYEYPEMRRCSQAVRHLSRHIPPAKLDEWGIEYTLDYCVPGQAVVTEPGTYHQVLNLGPNYAIAINMEYNSSPDMPLDYRFCDKHCPDKFAMSADDFRIYDEPPPRPGQEDHVPRTPETTGSQEGPAAVPSAAAPLRDAATGSLLTPTTPPPEPTVLDKDEPVIAQPVRPESRLQVPAVSGRQEQQACAESSLRAEAPQGSLLEVNTNTLPLPPVQSPYLIPSNLTSEGSVPSKPVPVGQFNLPPQQLNWVPVCQPSESQSKPLESRPPEPPPGLLQAAAAGPIQGRNLTVPATNGFPQSVAQSAQIVSPIHPIIPPEPDLRPCIRSSSETLPPIRKTARMINPDREPDTPTEGPSKKQKLELATTQFAQVSPVGGAFEHLSALLRGRQSSRPGSSVAEKLRGKPAFERLSRLVREWRQYTKSRPIVLGGFELVKTADDTLHSHPELHTFLSRLLKMQAAMFVGAATADSGDDSAEVSMNRLLQLLKWAETERHRLHDYLREGRCWRTICGGYDGLLCLLPPDLDCFDLALFKDDLAAFHSELNADFVLRLCAVGSALQKSIWECLELPEFIWESTTTTWLPEDDIAPLLAPFRLLKSNFFDENSGFAWPRPPRWPWHWPVDPSVVMPGDRPCNFCTRKSCRCIEITVPQVPRISDDGSKGPGIRSLGTHRANEVLGELVGELVPLGARAGDWTMALRRPDLDDEAVAEIYPRRMGNWVRKVNHSANPSAAFRMMKISGRWRQMLVAIRDIGDGEEITAKYGKGFFKRQPYSVVEGLH
ncbi:uncharacterized protein THITE_2111536 [Thermothielavioides terrestris NRRL 8126]|uniref:JmjC domain-containing protein n=1 Tax=Thermothielavioides terrestris (strain ATCC 38088 / NRRL 8126) TaxID=578455 RepID=G2R2R4_THETT|nr:uncharacterized protein THITE_2111536 [Thermothielavioides terrestris NRRL 8126]AEO65025.1 hypothetical protein THITE_2111536 [Thermothielavioides terrestris NRRL 8126]